MTEELYHYRKSNPKLAPLVIDIISDEQHVLNNSYHGGDVIDELANIHSIELNNITVFGANDSEQKPTASTVSPKLLSLFGHNGRRISYTDSYSAPVGAYESDENSLPLLRPVYSDDDITDNSYYEEYDSDAGINNQISDDDLRNNSAFVDTDVNNTIADNVASDTTIPVDTYNNINHNEKDDNDDMDITQFLV